MAVSHVARAPEELSNENLVFKCEKCENSGVGFVLGNSGPHPDKNCRIEISQQCPDKILETFKNFSGVSSKSTFRGPPYLRAQVP